MRSAYLDVIVLVLRDFASHEAASAQALGLLPSSSSSLGGDPKSVYCKSAPHKLHLLAFGLKSITTIQLHFDISASEEASALLGGLENRLY